MKQEQKENMQNITVQISEGAKDQLVFLKTMLCQSYSAIIERLIMNTKKNSRDDESIYSDIEHAQHSRNIQENKKLTKSQLENNEDMMCALMMHDFKQGEAYSKPSKIKLSIFEIIFYYLQEGKSYGEIANILNRNNLPTFGSRQNAKWSQAAIGRYIKAIVEERGQIYEMLDYYNMIPSNLKEIYEEKRRLYYTPKKSSAFQREDPS